MIVVDLPFNYQKRNLKEKIYKLLLIISKSEIAKKGSWALFFKIGGMFTIYLFHFLLARRIGAEANGIFSTFFTILSIFAVFSILGMDTFLLKKIAQFNSQKKWAELKSIYKKALSLILIISIFLIAILQFLYSFDHLESYHQNELLPYVALVLIPFSVLHINAESFRAIKNIKLFSFFKNFSIFGVAAFLLLFPFNNTPTIAVKTFVLSVFVLAIVSYVLWKKQLKINDSVLVEEFDNKSIIKESFPMFLSGSLFLLMSWVDILMLGHFNSQSDVGIYTIALKLAAPCTLFLFAANTILGPKISELYHRNKTERLSKIVQDTTKYSFLLSVPIFAIILIFPDFLLSLFGAEFNNKLATETLVILSAGQMVNVFFGAVIYILDMTGKQIKSRNILLFTAIINILLNWYLIPIYGIKGAAMATAFSIFCWTVLGAIAVKKYFGFYAFPYFKN